ncbi:MAG: hypothetical protein QOI20_88, partial [Acidimicrobiaceae bacterium]|nr:hypothetical protein [Acidimicrobiaceae bacterium]
LVGIEPRVESQVVRDTAMSMPVAFSRPAAPDAAGRRSETIGAPQPATASDPHAGGPSSGRLSNDAGRTTLLRFPEPGGGTGSINVVPNAPTRPLVCAVVSGYGGCVEKSALTVPAPPPSD